MVVEGPGHSSGVSRANAICSERSRWSAVTLDLLRKWAYCGSDTLRPLKNNDFNRG